jgi:NADPH-dependent curcumin reductase CurA
VEEGKIKVIETIYNGLLQAPDAMVDLMEGIGKGKLIVKL